MSNNVRFELDLPGLNELMKSAGMQSALDAAGRAVSQKAGSGYGVNTHVATYVAISNVYPITRKAKRAAFRNSLLKAASACGLGFEK